MTAVEATKVPVRGPRAWSLDVKAYRALGELGLIPEKTELLHGQVFHKMSKSPLHRFLVQRLLRILRQATLTDAFVWQEQPIVCGDSELEPDLSVILGNEEDFRTEHPTAAELVIEVCVSSHDYDRSKLAAYASAGVKECWLVLGPEKLIEVHCRPAQGGYAEFRVCGPGESVSSSFVPGVRVEIAEFFED